MYCMKCGREVSEDQVFCPECLELMEQDPIKIATPVHIPRQPSPGSAPRRPTLHTEEDMRRLERVADRLRAWVILLATALVLVVMACYYNSYAGGTDELGKNYSVVETGGTR